MSDPTPAPPPSSSPSPVAAGAPAAAVATPAGPKVTIPPKPAAPKAPAKAAPSRRNFLLSMIDSWFTAAWIAFSAAMAALTLGTVRFLFPNVLSEPPSTFRAGDVNTYEPNKVDDKYKEVGAWVIRS